MNRLAILLLAFAFVPLLSAQDNQADATPLPSEYKDNEVLPKSVSPDGRYGLIYPKAELSAEVEHPRLLLAELKPFRVVVEVSPEIFLEHGHNGYAVFWTNDSSALLVKADIKWGPDKVLLVPIRNGQASKVTDLVPEIEKMVRPDYKKSRAEPFNDEGTDFILEGAYIIPGKGEGQIIEEKWGFADHGHASISCFCTNDPKDLSEHSWTVRFEGTWDIAKGKFVGQKIKRLPSGPRKIQ